MSPPEFQPMCPPADSGAMNDLQFLSPSAMRPAIVMRHPMTDSYISTMPFRIPFGVGTSGKDFRRGPDKEPV